MKKYKYIIGIIVILIIAIVLRSHTNSNKTSNNGGIIMLNSNDITTVKFGDVQDLITFTGDLSPLKQTMITSEAEAQIKQVLVQEGARVKQNQTLALLDDIQLKQDLSRQQAQLEAAKAQLNLDKLKMNKNKELYDQGFISKIAYDELVNAYTNSKEIVIQQQALVTNAKKQLSDSIIKAPFDGIIYKKNAEPGLLASKNTSLFSIANLDTLEIKSSIPSSKINLIKLNQQVEFKIETSSQLYRGKIARINPVAEDGTRSYMVYIEFDNRKDNLKAGQFVRGNIVLNSIKDALYVPNDTIYTENNKQYVSIIQNNTVVAKPINVILINNATNTAVINGIESGTQILNGSAVSVKIGDKVSIIK